MIGFFPDPYPDELLYSACARYAQRVNYPNKHSVGKELFDKANCSAIFDFPTQLEHFVSVLPNGHNYSIDKLINENTLLPFHLPFLPKERIQQIYDDMSWKGKNKLQMRLGIKVKQIEPPKYLRYCPECVKEDILQYDETYWHRIHQLGGISVCSNHQCFLEDSCVEIGRFSTDFFHNANKYIPITLNASRSLDLSKKHHQILIKLAKDAEWLLANPISSFNSSIIRDRYFNTLLKQGFAYYNGRAKHTKLFNACEEFFSKEIFNDVGRKSKRNKWLSILVDKSTVGSVYHPIRHLLLITFLGFTAQDFFTSFIEFKPFGDSPYPCLNKASAHYRDLRIKKYELFENRTKHDKYRRPIAIFECDCGFIYQRLGPDKSESDKYRYNSIRQHGRIWDNKLKDLWADLSISVSEIGRRIGVSGTTVSRFAIRFGLEMNTPKSRIVQGYRRHRNPRLLFPQIKKDYRQKWVSIRLKYPDLFRKDLIKKGNNIYNWLRRNDWDWLENNIPKSRKVGRIGEKLNWSKIDLELSKKIKNTYKEIKDFKKFPLRISLAEIMRRVGNRTWLHNRHKNLPLTTKTLNENLESWEDFMVRKVKWGKDFFIKEKKIPTLLQFKTKVALRNNTSSNSST